MLYSGTGTGGGVGVGVGVGDGEGVGVGVGVGATIVEDTLTKHRANVVSGGNQGFVGTVALLFTVTL